MSSLCTTLNHCVFRMKPIFVQTLFWSVKTLCWCWSSNRAEIPLSAFPSGTEIPKPDRKIHTGSAGVDVKALLVLSKAEHYLDCVEGVVGCSPELLSGQIRSIMGVSPYQQSIDGWLKSGFCSVPARTAEAEDICYMCSETVLSEAETTENLDERLIFYTRTPDDTQHLYYYDSQTDEFFYMDHCRTGEGIWYEYGGYPTFPIVEITKERAAQIAAGNLNLPGGL